MRTKKSHHSRLSILALAAFVCLACASPVDKKHTPTDRRETGAARDEADEFTSGAASDAPRPQILSRLEWGAKEAAGEMKPHTLRHITVHHTASPQKAGVPLEKKMQGLQNFAQSKGRLAGGATKPAWPDVPYHYYIAADGRIAEGRDLKFVGDTNTDYEPAGHALVVLEGNFEKEQPSPAQVESLRALAAWLSAEYGLPATEIKGHSDYASTACPGRNLKKALPTLRQEVARARDANGRR